MHVKVLMVITRRIERECITFKPKEGVCVELECSGSSPEISTAHLDTLKKKPQGGLDGTDIAFITHIIEAPMVADL